MADNATASADCCVRDAMVIKGLRIRKAQEMLLFFVFYEKAFYFQLSGERNEEKHKQSYSWFLKTQIKYFAPWFLHKCLQGLG